MKLQILDAQTHETLFDFDLVSVIRHNRKCIVGRSATSNLILGNPDISRCHGEFSYQNGEYYFTDTGSSNGSLINDTLATKEHAYLLKAGDVIRLGDFLLVPQPFAGIYEDATDIAPIAFTSRSNGAKPGELEISASPEIRHEIARAQPVDESTQEELPAVVATPPLDVEQSYINDISLEESIENIPVKEMHTVEASTPPEVAAESSTTDISDAIVNEFKLEDSTADTSLEKPPEDNSAKDTDTAALQESVLPEAIAQSGTTDIPPAIAETSEPGKESHPDTAVVKKIVEENATAVAETSAPEEVTQASSVKTSESSMPATSTPTANVAAQAARSTENTHIQSSPPKLIDPESTDAIDSSTSEASDEEWGDSNDSSVAPEIFQGKYIVLLAHDSQKAELVNFILRHPATFSKCLLMAPSVISQVLDENNIFVRRVLPNLTAGGYQEVNSLIASKNLLGVIFLRDFLNLQSSQANDEALCRLCSINQVILATNIATAQAFEGYLQYLIASVMRQESVELISYK